MLLDIFLASLMRENADLRARIQGAGITNGQLRTVKEQAKAARVLGGRILNPTDFVDFFGPPLQSDARQWRYELLLWPEHYYELELTEWGGLLDKGFALKVPDVRLPASVSVDRDAVENILRRGFHTQIEVKRVLGTPAETQGWNAMEDWFYGPVRGDQYLVMEFDFSLLVNVSQRPLITLPT
jgi:hypothetical protein